MINVQELKQKAIAYLERNGPTIPVRIARELKVDPMWAGAILSELLQHHNIKFTSMKVGSTPIYYLEGQEKQLEKFADEHLKDIPKQTYLLLKKEIVLDDAMQNPQTRVALRSLKDFAVMFNNNGRIMWRYAFATEEEVDEGLGISKNTAEEESEGKEENNRSVINGDDSGSQNEQSKIDELGGRGSTILTNKANNKQNASSELRNEDPEAPEEKNEEAEEESEGKQPENIFEETKGETTDAEEKSLLELVGPKLEKLNIKILEETDVKKKELKLLGRMNGPLGETEILIMAKDKKSLTEKDFEKIFEQIKEEKKQVLLFTTGEIAKKAIEPYRDYKHLIKVRPL